MVQRDEVISQESISINPILCFIEGILKRGHIIGWAFSPCVKCNSGLLLINLIECIILYLDNVMVK